MKSRNRQESLLLIIVILIIPISLQISELGHKKQSIDIGNIKNAIGEDATEIALGSEDSGNFMDSGESIWYHSILSSGYYKFEVSSSHDLDTSLKYYVGQSLVETIDRNTGPEIEFIYFNLSQNQLDCYFEIYAEFGGGFVTVKLSTDTTGGISQTPTGEDSNQLILGGEDSGKYISSGESIWYHSVLNSGYYKFEVSSSHDLDTSLKYYKGQTLMENIDTNTGPEIEFIYFQLNQDQLVCYFEVYAKLGGGSVTAKLLIDTTEGLGGGSPTGQDSIPLSISSNGLGGGYIESGESLTYHSELTIGSYKITSGGSHDLDVRLTIYDPNGTMISVNDFAYSEDESIVFKVENVGVYYFYIEAIGGGGFLETTLTEVEISQQGFFSDEIPIEIIIVIIVIVTIVVLTTASLIIKRIKSKESRPQYRPYQPYQSQTQIERQIIKKQRIVKEKELLEKIKNMIDVSTKIKLDIMQDALKLDKTTFNNKLFEWARQFDFTVDGDYIIVNKETLSNYMDELDHQFEVWYEGEKKRDTKI